MSIPRSVPTLVSITQTRDMSAADAVEENVPTDFDQIKATIEPLRQIFGVLLENTQLRYISHIVPNDTRPQSKGSSPVVYTVFTDGSDGGEVRCGKGRAVFPPGTSTEMQTAVLKLDGCDLSLLAFFPHVTDALQKIGARVDWLVVDAEPHILIHYSSEGLSEPIHSVFGITSSSGQQFIADFTIEQFGYEDDCWFSKKSDYLHHCTKDGNFRLAADDEVADLEEDVPRNAHMSSFVETVKNVYDELDWKTYENLPQEERQSWVKTSTQEVLQQLYSEG